MAFDDARKSKTTWKDRLLDSWHQPCYLKGSSAGTTNQHKAGLSKSPRRRKRRALSSERRSNPQSDCIFLSRLPGEIRNAIYLLILGNRRLSIYRSSTKATKHRLGHHELQPDQKRISQGWILSVCNHPATNKLAILQACRQIYAEAADVLYTTNCFELRSIDHVKAFNLFAGAASSTRLACITQLTVVCAVDCFEPHNPLASTVFKLWRTMWTTVSSQMSGLCHLTLQLLNTSIFFNIQLSADSYWVKPFLQVRNLQTFRLLVEKGKSVTGDDVVTAVEPRCRLFVRLRDLDGKVERLRHHSEKLLCSPPSDPGPRS